MAADTAAAPDLENARAPNRSRRLFRHHKNPREVSTVLLQMLTAEVGPSLHFGAVQQFGRFWSEADIGARFNTLSRLTARESV
jgi:hypothetical protein